MHALRNRRIVSWIGFFVMFVLFGAIWAKLVYMNRSNVNDTITLIILPILHLVFLRWDQIRQLFNSGKMQFHVDFGTPMLVFCALHFGLIFGVALCLFDAIVSFYHSIEGRLVEKRSLIVSAGIFLFNFSSCFLLVLPVGLAAESHFPGHPLLRFLLIALMIGVLDKGQTEFAVLVWGDQISNKQSKGKGRTACISGLVRDYAYFTFICFGPFLLVSMQVAFGPGGFMIGSLMIHIAQRTGRLYARLEAQQQALFTDELTGIGNSMKFRVDMEGAENLGAYALVMMDLDDFKQINDRYGHAAGDQALTVFASALHNFASASPEQTCKAYRLHGDEFVLHLKQHARVNEIVKALEVSMAGMQMQWEEQTVPLSCSGGATVVHRPVSVRTALVQADRCLYWAKQKRKGSFFLEDEVENLPGASP